MTTLSHERHWSRLQAQGAKRCLSDTLHNGAAAERGYFAVIDAVGPENAAHLATCLLVNDHLVLGALHQHGDAQQWRALTQQGERLMAQLVQGALKSELLLHFPYDQLPAQLLALQHRNFSGKQIILL